MKKLSYRKVLLLFIISLTSIMVYSQKIDCDHSQLYFMDDPVEPAIRTHALRIASENNLNTQHLQNEWYFSIIVGITSETTNYYGGFDAVKAMILDQFETVNAAFNDPGVFNERFNFRVESIYEFSGDVDSEIFKSHPNHDYKVIIDGYPDHGGGWYDSYSTIYHSWPTSSHGGPFGNSATDGLIHEWGHSRGAIDLYALRVEGKNNQVNGEDYDIPFSSIMNYPYGINIWDEHSISLININAGKVITNLDYIHNSFPSKILFQVEDPLGNPIIGARVKLFPVRWYSKRIYENPLLEIKTDIFGNAALEENPFQPSKSSNEAWRIEYCNFLIEVSLGGLNFYKWMPIFDVQNHYFNDPFSSYEMSFTLPSSVGNIMVNAKGSKAEGQYAHFKVLVDGQEIGDSYTTSEYKSYIFPLSIDPSEIQEVRIRFDNDLYTVEEDRNLFVKSITIGTKPSIVATSETVSYISANGHPQVYNGMMCWNGELIYAIEDISKPIPYTYSSFQGDTYELFLWEGEKVAILSEKKNLDKNIMQQMVDTFDKVYDYYYKTTGRKPELSFHYNGKITIAQVDNTCGAGCAYLGNTGIELLDYYFNLLYNTLGDDNLYDQILFYEFGRNFWFYGNKIDWSGSSGTVTTGYAVFMRFMSMKAAGVNGAPYNGRPFTEFENEVKSLFNKYMADASLNWENTIKIGKAPDNSINLGGTDLFASFMFKLMDLFGIEFNDAIWKEVEKRPDAVNEYDAADNFILASSIVANENLVPLFQTWKWPVSQVAIDEANHLFGTSSLVINAKGSEAGGIYAHFKILVNDQEIGDGFTTSNYEPYVFSLPLDPSSITEIRIVFDNDLYTVVEDRNLFVRSITIGEGAPMEATSETVSYISVNGHEQVYNGMMGWNGELIFKIIAPIVNCDQDIMLTSQAEVNALDCEIISGNLTISGKDITDLSPITSLLRIDGYLSIKDNPNLKIIDGLNSILIISGELNIQNNIILEHISGLNSLSKCFNIWIDGNNSLLNINGFTSLSNVIDCSVAVRNNPKLRDIKGFKSLQSVTGIQLINNNSLMCINGFSSLKEIHNNLLIMRNAQLEHLDDLYSLSYCYALRIVENNSLKDTKGLTTLNMTYHIEIRDNPMLEKLNGFAFKDAMIYGIQILRNYKLQNIMGLQGITHITGYLAIEENASLTSLSGLCSLSTVEKGISISENRAIEDLRGFEKMIETNKLFITDNENLVNFCGLYPLFNEGFVDNWNFNNNGIDITKEEILANGPCAETNEIIVSAKGTPGNSEYAQLKVYADKMLLGETYSTAEFTQHRFAIPYDPARINKVRIIFNNDYSSTFEDRNLIIEYILINGRRFDATPDEVTYIRDMDRQEIYYDYIMPWNGQLIFDINYALASNARMNGIFEVEEQLKESLEFNLDIYPNPSNGLLNIKFENAQKGSADLFITNTAGKHVHHEQFIINAEEYFRSFDLSDLQQGLYVIQFNNNDRQVNKKLIIK